MNMIFKYAWVLFITMTMINGIVLKIRSKKYIEENPDLKDGYNKLIKGWLIYGNIPWTIMAIGDLTGETNGIWEYFNPKLMNPIVLVFHFSIIAIWIIGSNWIYFKNGAGFLARHPGFLKLSGPGYSKDITSSKTIKIFWSLGMLGGIAGMIMMWIFDFPILNY